MIKLFHLHALFLLALVSPCHADQIQTLAGTGEPGFSGDGGPADQAQVNNPFGVDLGPDGNIYFCDTGNHCVRKIDRETNIISTVAGSGGEKGYSGDGGPATEAKMYEPYELRFDKDGNLFVVEMKNHIVRRIDAETKIITTVAGTGEAGFSGDGGPAAAAKLNRPHSVVIDKNGDLYICDIGNHRIRRVNGEHGKISTYCGTGQKGRSCRRGEDLAFNISERAARTGHRCGGKPLARFARGQPGGQI